MEQKQEYKIDDRPSTIFRTIKNKDNPYVMIDQRPILNKELSWKAKGILSYLVSRPDGWECNFNDLVNRSTDGLSSVKAGVQELMDAGHIKKSQIRTEDGKWGNVLWEVYEQPQPQVENPLTVKPQADNRTQVLKKLNNKDISSRQEKIIEQATSTSPQGLSLESFSNKVFTKVTNMIAIPGKDRDSALRVIEALRNQYPLPESLADYLKPFWEAWNNKGYGRTNLAWLTDWAVSGEIPVSRGNINNRERLIQQLSEA